MIALIIYINYLYFYFSISALIGGWIFFWVFYLLIWGIVKSWRKIIPKESGNFKREFFFTLSNFCIYFLIVHICFLFFLQWYIPLDFSVNIFIPFVILAFILWHDAYFYVLHRLLHQKWMLKNIHYVHHQSNISSVWTSYSFHPVEGIMYTWVTLGIFFLPMNFYALLGAILYNDMLTILWHSWKENFSKKYLRSHKIFKFLATPSFHDMHHSRNIWNFALYFLYLDKLFWTYDTKHKNIVYDK